MEFAVNLALSVLKKFMTEKFFGKLIMVGARLLARSQKNNVTQELCDAFGKALDEPCGDVDAK